MSAKSAKAAIVEAKDEQVETPTDRVLTLEDIMAAEDITEKTIPIEEWKGSVVIRSLTKRELDKVIEASDVAGGDTDMTEMQKWIFLLGLHQPKIPVEQFEAFQNKSASAFMKILMAIMEQSNLKGLTGKKELEERFRS